MTAGVSTQTLAAIENSFTPNQPITNPQPLFLIHTLEQNSRRQMLRGCVDPGDPGRDPGVDCYKLNQFVIPAISS